MNDHDHNMTMLNQPNHTQAYGDAVLRLIAENHRLGESLKEANEETFKANAQTIEVARQRDVLATGSVRLRDTLQEIAEWKPEKLPNSSGVPDPQFAVDDAIWASEAENIIEDAQSALKYFETVTGTGGD